MSTNLSLLETFEESTVHRIRITDADGEEMRVLVEDMGKVIQSKDA